MLNQIILAGCAPEPLSNYLKALGILRLVVEQGKDRGAKGYWQTHTFVLETQLSSDELEQFFLHEYSPTPLVAPWNGSTGFYSKDNKKTLDTIRRSQAKRLSLYRETIQSAQQQVDTLGLTTQPKDDEKRQLITQLRNHLPDEAVKWLDTCALITSDEMKFPPLTGTGGNDGNFEFSRTFMQQLQEVFELETGKPQVQAALLLKATLFDAIVPGLPFAGKIGQFNPIAAGGTNAAPGYDADSRVNPWDFILMLEGIMLFVAGATRRYERSDRGELTYPFMVQASISGYGSASQQDKARSELWTPLWSNPVGLKELQSLFGEGRAKVGGRAARDGIDFARAVSSLGVSRGLDGFIRYSFQERNGLSYFAIPLGCFHPKLNLQMDLLAQIDPWLVQLRRVAQDSKAPGSIKQVYRSFEATIIDLAREKAKLLDVIVALGAIEAALDRSFKYVNEKYLKPLPYIKSGKWLRDCDDDSREFRLGLSLASLDLRQRLVRVRGQTAYWAEQEDGITIWENGSLPKNLIAWVRRLAIEAERTEKQPVELEGVQASETPDSEQKKPLYLLANLDDIVAWIEGVVDDQRVEAIARGLCLIRSSRPLLQRQVSRLKPPAAYSLTAIVHRRVINPELKLPSVPELLSRLASGDCMTATRLASRRLHASGLRPAIREGIYEPRDRTLRIAAALAFPISANDVGQLLKQVQQIEEDK
jgi:CRISPR-associated protein Csx17